ncbi:hypothetical protein N1028_17820 [Herbiconiux sp. CPCC 203407]|uniref:Uncharacterized protein n=1 Tax=Herbiconiux oxytropis TaxID=2970915 RepID=A0AA41XGU9_9MICO|nr:hypothetical protein [Herbiconiux oxytropis]MCS5722827.1 hypothetical protein [Herbiconiux oxytropis]MCS5727757.1 hypothetical protein [Herbiconiux oxytropis]
MQRLPPPSWPVWVLFALLLVPGLVMLGLLGGLKDASGELLAQSEDAVGRNIVLTGTLVDVETDSGMPVSTGIYEVTIPAGEGGAAETVTFRGDEHWGFPPDPDHPAELSFRVVLDDPPRPAAHGPVGSVEPVTEASVQADREALATNEAVWVGGIVVFWLFALGMPALGVVLAVRRRRAKQAVRAATATGAVGSPTAAAWAAHAPFDSRLPPPRI